MGANQNQSAQKYLIKFLKKWTFHFSKNGHFYFPIILPKRWIVERTLAWISYSRKSSRDYERLTDTSQAMTQLAMIRIFINRI
jgi:transposase